MKNKKFMCMLLAASLAVSGTSAFAADQNDVSNLEISDAASDVTFEALQNSDLQIKLDENTSGQFSSLSILDADIAGVFSDMTNSITNGGNLSFSDALQNNSDISLSTEQLFDMSDMTLIMGTIQDMGSVNLQYQTLAAKMADSYGSVDLSGNSLNCMSLFDNTYGDIADQVSLSDPEIPEGFTVENMLGSATDAISSAYSSGTNSGSFASIKGPVGIGKIFSIANSGLSMPSLASDSSMKSMMSSMDAINYSNIYGSYKTSQSTIKKQNKSNTGGLYKNANKTLLNMVDMDSAVVGMDGSINKANLRAKALKANGIFNNINVKRDNSGKKSNRSNNNTKTDPTYESEVHDAFMEK